MKSKLIHELVLAAAAQRTTKPAFRHISSGRVRKIIYGDIPRLTALFAAAFASRGVQEGDRIILCADNSPEWVLACLAAFRLGVTVVPVDSRSRQSDLEAIAEKVHPKLFLLGKTQHALLSQSLDEHRVALLDSFLDEVPEGSPFRQSVRFKAISEDTPALIVFTSGTSGNSKGVVLTHKNIVSNVRDIVKRFTVTPEDKLLSVLPLSHMFEYTAGLIGPLLCGACIVYCRLRGPEHLKEILKIERITVLIGVPAIYQNILKGVEARLAELPAALGSSLSKARRLTGTSAGSAAGRLLFQSIRKELGGEINFWAAGGAPVPADVVTGLGSLGIPVLAGYGLTEASPIVAANMRADNRPGSVGRPLPGVSVRILPKEEAAVEEGHHEKPVPGATTPSGQNVGEIVISGDNVMQGYFADEQATNAVLKDGWLHTGDLGYLDKDGYLYVTGRSKSLIVTGGGYNIYPEEIEQSLELSPLIKEACVFGIATNSGEQAHALIVPADQVRHEQNLEQTLKDEIARCLCDLAEYKRLSGFQVLTEPLPRTPTRKVQRGKVLDIYQNLQSNALPAEHEAVEWDEVGRKVCDIIREVADHSLGDTLPAIKARSTISGDLGIDSFAKLEVGLRLCESFAVDLSDEAINDAQTVADLIALVKAQKEGNGQNAASSCAPSSGGKNGHTKGEIGFDHLSASVKPWPYSSKPDGELNRPDAPKVAAARRSIVLAVKLLLHFFSDFRVIGAEHLDIDPPFIVVANHSSHVDTAAIFASFPQRLVAHLHPVAAADTFFADRFSAVVATNFLNAIPFDRYGDFSRSMEECEDVLRSGEILIMFPEGTRSSSGEIGTFHNGAARLAGSVGCPIVPAYIDGAYEIMPKRAVFPKRGKLSITFGEPIQPPSNGGDFKQINELTKLAREAVLALAPLKEPQ